MCPLPDLAARAEGLAERLARVPAGTVRDLSPTALATALGPWARAYSRGDLDALLRRLAWDRIDPAVAAAVLAGDEPRAAVPAAGLEWTSWFERVMDVAAEPAGSVAAGLARELPFGELWLPWSRVATAELMAGLPEDPGRGESWLPSAQRLLVAELARVGAPVAFQGFDESRLGDPAPGCYRRYVETLLGDLHGKFLAAMPGLARRLSGIAGSWVEAIRELVTRYASDRRAIGELFGGGDPGAISELGGGFSDRHAGRQVLRVRLSGGLTLAYKPRELAMECAWENLLGWLRGEGLDFVPPAPRCLARPGYGWQEWLASEPAIDREAAARYYRGAGALVALAMLLGARDLHGENLVATARGPAVVDAEMMLQPVFPQVASTAADCRDRAVRVSLMDSGLLSTPVPLGGGRVLDRAGLRAPVRRLVRIAAPRWTGLGSDAIRLETAEEWSGPDANALWLEGQPTRPEEFGEELAAGLAAVYRFVLERRGELLDERGPLAAFAPARARILLRPSQEYARILAELARPRFLSHALATGLALEAFVGTFSEEIERPPLWSLVAEEREALLAGDVPRFTVPAAAGELSTADGREVVLRFERSALEHARARLASASAEHLEDQLELLAAALAPQGEDGHTIPDGSAGEGAPQRAGERFRRIAEAMGIRLEEQLERRRELDTGADLGAGTLGIALFLAALGERTGETRFTRAAERLVVQTESRRAAVPGARRSALGAFTGVGGQLYALAWLDRLVPGGPGLGIAKRILAAITREEVEADRRLDLEGGAAGAILGLLALGGSTLGDEALWTARACGEHLLRRQEPLGSGVAGWRSESGLALAGCAHGASGIARALAALAEATGEARFAVAATAAIAFERQQFDPGRGNWPVRARRADGTERRFWMTSWCHGAPGAALCRLLLPERFQDEDLSRELGAALDSTAAAPVGTLDHLCCGNLGRASVLLTAALRTGRGEHLAAAARLTGAVLDRATAPGSDFGFSTDAAEQLRPPSGFLRGLAGIGYHLLRISDPYGLPDALALESPREAADSREEGTA